MSDEKQQGMEFKTDDIDNWIEAIIYILSGFAFLFKNYKKTTLFVVVIISFLIWQFLANFQQWKDLVDLFG